MIDLKSFQQSNKEFTAILILSFHLNIKLNK